MGGDILSILLGALGDKSGESGKFGLLQGLLSSISQEDPAKPPSYGMPHVDARDRGNPLPWQNYKDISHYLK